MKALISLLCVICFSFMTPAFMWVQEIEYNDKPYAATYIGDIENLLGAKGILSDRTDIDVYKISNNRHKAGLATIAVFTEILGQSSSGGVLPPQTWFSPTLYLFDSHGHQWFKWTSPLTTAILFDVPIFPDDILYVGVGYGGPTYPGGSPSDYQMSIVTDLEQ